MATTAENVIAILKKHKHVLQEKYGVKEIGIFGSLARKEQKATSDIDIVVDFYEVPDILELIRLERYLQRILGRKVDLIRKQALRKELKKRILNEAIYT